MRSTIPFSTTKFEIVEGTITKNEILQEYRDQIAWMKTQQEYYFTHDLDSTIQKIQDSGVGIKGSLNSYGRSIGLEPHEQYSNQPYNMAEMFRVSTLMSTAGFMQDSMIADMIIDDSTTVEDVLESWDKNFKKPTWFHVQAVIDRVRATGIVAGVPSSKGSLPLWACDTHHTKLSRDGRNVFLTTKNSMGQFTLKFTLPASERFTGGKVTRPTVGLNHKGEVVFHFTIQESFEPPEVTKPVLGVDLGKVVPFVGTVVDGEHYSPPLLPNHRVNKIQAKLERLYYHKDILFKKYVHEVSLGHSVKAGILYTEYSRVRSKISRLKVELAHHVANQLLDIALSYGASILFENLKWVGSKGGKWDHARVQQSTRDKAVRKRVTVRTTRAAGTSVACSKCGSTITHENTEKRTITCHDCHACLDRDVTGSKNIAYRGFGSKIKPSLLLQSAHTRVSRRSSIVQQGNWFSESNKPRNKLL